MNATIPNKQTTRFARWLSTDVKWSLENGRTALLMVSVGGQESFYYVSIVDNAVRMAKESSDHSEPQEGYSVQFGEWPSCTCKDFTIRRRGISPCKHITALTAALNAIGIKV